MRNKMTKKIVWFLLVLFAVLIGVYPLLYFFIDREFGLLATKADELLADVFWNMAFYAHIIPGGIALLVGWTQFRPGFRNKHLALHRTIGKVYVVSVLISAAGGIYIGFFANSGIVAASGFITLGVFWFYTTWMAYHTIRKGDVEKHRRLMMYSYAACFAAVTLRIWFPLFMVLTGDYDTGYRIAAWFCWLPNIGVVYLLLRKKEKTVLRRYDSVWFL